MTGFQKFLITLVTICIFGLWFYPILMPKIVDQNTWGLLYLPIVIFTGWWMYYIGKILDID